MIPATFAPMIFKLVFPKLEKKMDELRLDIIEHIFKVGKIKESIAYRELPNDADKRIDKLEAQIKMLAEDQHPPAIPLKEINEFRETNKNVKWIMGIFKNMKKNPLLKSMFK